MDPAAARHAGSCDRRILTGAQAAMTFGLAAARNEVLECVGWAVERDGLLGAPPVRVVAGVERHAIGDRI